MNGRKGAIARQEQRPGYGTGQRNRECVREICEAGDAEVPCLEEIVAAVDNRFCVGRVVLIGELPSGSAAGERFPDARVHGAVR